VDSTNHETSVFSTLFLICCLNNYLHRR